MAYYINPANLSAVFTVPCLVSDKHLKLCTALQLKVLIYFLRNMSNGVLPENIADFLSVPTKDVEDALLYWVSQGVLLGESNTVNPPEKTAKPTVVRAEKPSRADVARRGTEDKKIMFLLREAQLKFGRNLKSNETSTLVWLYDDNGMDVSVILMLIQYAVSEGRGNISFIEKTALDWLEKGIDNVTAAEAEIAESIKRKTAWSVVQSAFGMEKRQPSTKELEFSDKWINDWGMSRELLKSAYDSCIDTKTKLSMPYINKILESWHKSDVKNVSDINKKPQRTAKTTASGGATYDIDLFEQMLNSDD